MLTARTPSIPAARWWPAPWAALFLAVAADPHSVYAAGEWLLWDAMFGAAAVSSVALLLWPGQHRLRGLAVFLAVAAMATRAAVLVLTEQTASWAVAVWPVACTAFMLLALWSGAQLVRGPRV